MLQDLISHLTKEYSDLPEVEAVALAGSRTTFLSNNADSEDVDLYVYCRSVISIETRRRIAGGNAEVGNTFFEPGDEWTDPATGVALDVMFRQMEWIETQLARVIDQHQASIGYSTCFWHNVLFSEKLFDRNGWFSSLQGKARQHYPEQLRREILDKNFPILRDTQSSFLHQLERAVARRDSVSIQHRTTALLASYFDVLFAINRVLHPGEKRLVLFAERICKRLPQNMRQQIDGLISSRFEERVGLANTLIDDLEKLLD